MLRPYAAAARLWRAALSVTLALPLFAALFWSGAASAAITLTPATLPAAIVGSPYSQFITASGGLPPYVYTMIADGTPPGLLYDSAGQIYGTPTTPGTYTFTFGAQDTVATLGTQVITIQIVAPPSPPTATITLSDYSLSAGETSTVTFTFNGAVNGFDSGDVTISSGSLGALSTADNITFTATFIPNANTSAPTNVITVANSGVTTQVGSLAGNGTSSSGNYTVNTVRPSATINVNDTALKIGETSVVGISFTETGISGFSVADLTVANGTLSGLSVVEGSIWTATLTPTANIEDATNLITLDLSGVTNSAGNTGLGSVDSNNYAIDTRRPTATIVMSDLALASGETSDVSITFTEAVTGVGVGALTVENGNVASLSSFDGGITWTGTFAPSAGVTDPTNQITLDTSTVVDAAGNAGAGTASSANYAVDGVAATATLAVADANLSSGETTTLTITFSEPVVAFDNADLSVGNATLSAVASIDGGITWTATLTPDAGNTSTGNLVTLANGGVTDIAGNAGKGSTDSNAYDIDTVLPTLTSTVVDTQLTTGETTTVQFLFSEAVSGFSAADTTVENGSIDTPTTADGITWTATLTPTAGVFDDTNQIGADMSGVTDAAGNAGSGENLSNNYSVDTAVRSLSIDDVSVSEGDAGTTAATFTISLDLPAGPGGVSFDITPAAGSAASGVDFSASAVVGQSIAAGASTATYTVLVNGDTLNEADETYSVGVANVVGATVADASGAGTIVNDDALPGLAIAGASVVEGDSGTTDLVLQVTLDAASERQVTVDFATADAGASAGSDYAATTGTLTFAAGDTSETITVVVNGDTTPEGDEAFDVTLSAPVNASLVTASASGTISNDDTPVAVSPSSLPTATVGVGFVQTIGATGGDGGPYTFAVTSGGLPAGLMLDTDGQLHGTPTAAGAAGFTITATDGSAAPGPYTGSQSYEFIVDAPTLVLTPAATTFAADYGVAFAQAFSTSGGTAPYSYSVSGPLPAGLNLSGDTLSGTATEPGTFTFSITATDSSTGGEAPYSTTVDYTVEVATAITIDPDTLPGATVGSPYTGQLTPQGVIAPYNFWIVDPGNFPPGLTFNGGGAIGGTPTTAGSYTFTVQVSDNNTQGTTKTYTLAVGEDAPIANAVSANVGYGSAANAIAPDLDGGDPASLAIATAAAHGSATVNGLMLEYTPDPGFAGTDTFTYTATNTGGSSAPATVTVTVAAPDVVLAPGATTFSATYVTAFMQTFAASGGTGPYSYAVTGTLPAGLTFAGDTLSGAPTEAGSFGFTVTAADSSSGDGPFQAAVDYTIDIAAPTVSISPATLPDATVDEPYVGALVASGGDGTYAFWIASGDYPPGLTFNGAGAIGGTPTTAGDFTFVVEVADGNTFGTQREYTLRVGIAAPIAGDVPLSVDYGSVDNTITPPLSGGPADTIAISAAPAHGSAALAANPLQMVYTPAPGFAGTDSFQYTATNSAGTSAPATVSVIVFTPTLVLSPGGGTLAAAYATAFSQSFSASGGFAPYTYVLTGTLPAGVTLVGDTLAGTPGESGTFGFTITATDSSSGAAAPFSVSAEYTLEVAAAAITITPATLPAATVGSAYEGELAASGGVAPYSFWIASGSPPPGISFYGGGEYDGSPTTPGSYSFVVEVMDANGAGTTREYTIEVAADPPVANDVAASVAYDSSANAIAPDLAGGAATTLAIASAAGNGSAAVNGLMLEYTPDPGFAGTDSFTYTASNDSGTSAPATVTVQVLPPVLAFTTTGQDNATIGQAYTLVFVLTGGRAPVTFDASGLPAGLSASSDGDRTLTISGTPSATGAFTVHVLATDSSDGDGPFDAETDFALDVLAPQLVLKPDAGILVAGYDLQYGQAFVASNGTAPYTYTLDGALPTGLSFSDGLLSGQPTEPGEFDFSVTAVDSSTGSEGAFTITQSYRLVIEAPVIVVVPETIPNGMIGTPYNVAFGGNGGSAPYTFHFEGGAPPDGLTLSAAGQLSGTPTLAGNYPFTVVASDANGQTGSQYYEVDIAVALPVAADVATTVAYNSSDNPMPLDIDGGGPVDWVDVTTFASNGSTVIAGTTISYTPNPGFVGEDTFDYVANNGSGSSAVARVTITVTPPVIEIGPATLPDGQVGVAYDGQLTVSGIVAPYNFWIASGTFPPGLDFNGGGLIWGTPTTAGRFDFVVEVVDSFGQGSTRDYTIVIADTAPVAADVAATVAYGSSDNPVPLALSGGAATSVAVASAPANGSAVASGTGIAYTPAVGFAGSDSFTYTASNSGGTSAPATVTITVSAPTLVLLPAASHFDAAYGTAFTQAFAASGGSGPYAYALTGELPDGLAFAGDTLSGSPTRPGSYAFTITATDSSTGSGAPFSVAVDYTLTVDGSPPLAVDDSAETLTGEPVTIAVLGNDSGDITGFEVVADPEHGDVSVAASGDAAVYVSDSGFAGDDSFTYVAIGPGGRSAPATVRVTVQARPVALSRVVEVAPDTTIRVELTEGGSGGPFVDATLVAFGPTAAGTVELVRHDDGFALEFTPSAGYSGEAQLRFTLANASAVSAEATITFTIAPRPDPTDDPGVQASIDAQVESVRRFATTQIGNFQGRLETLHDKGDGGFDNGIGFATGERCPQRPLPDLDSVLGNDCDSGDALAAGNGLGASPGSGGNGTQRNGGGPLAFWTAGTIRSGAMDGRNGGERIDFETDGISAGVDHRVNAQFAIGAGIGYGKDDNEVGENGSRVDGEAWSLGLYGSWHRGEWFVDGLLGWQELDWNLRRFDNGSGTRVNAYREGTQWFGSLTAGADLGGETVQFTPYARLDFGRAELDGYSEQGGAGIALDYSAMDVDTTVANVGLRLDFRQETGWGVLTPQLRAEYQYDLHGTAAADIRYADMLTGPVYRVESSRFDGSRFVFGLGALLEPGNDWLLRLEYRGLVGSGGQRDNGLLFSAERSY